MGYGTSIAEAIARMGHARAQGELQKGQIYGNMAQNLGQLPFQAMDFAQRLKGSDQIQRLREIQIQQEGLQNQEMARKLNLEKRVAAVAQDPNLPTPEMKIEKIREILQEDPGELQQFEKHLIDLDTNARNINTARQGTPGTSLLMPPQMQGQALPPQSPVSPEGMGPPSLGNALISPRMMAPPNIPMPRVHAPIKTSIGVPLTAQTDVEKSLAEQEKGQAASDMMEKRQKNVAAFEAGLDKGGSGQEHVEPDPKSSTGYRYMQYNKKTNKYDLPSGEAPPRGAQTDEEMVALRKALMLKNLNKPDAAEGPGRLDKSYQYNATQLANLGKAVRDRSERLDRLRVSLDSNSPQADALIAPELLTAMAGGQGSGLRMNEAEIARIVGGRSHWESLKASLNKWQLDPSQALSITPAQRAEIRQLVNAMSEKVNNKMNILDQAQQELINANDVVKHRQTVSNAQKALTAIDAGGGGETTNPAAEALRKKYNY